MLHIVHARLPARAKAPRKPRPPPPCGTFVTAKHPKGAAALRTAFESLRADPVPVRRDVAGLRKASAAEIQECLAFAGHADQMMVTRTAAERLLEHLQACGMVLMAKDDAGI